jgi:hypothetical protein
LHAKLTERTIYAASTTSSNILAIGYMVATVLSCAQLMPLTLEWQSDWPERRTYTYINTMLQLGFGTLLLWHHIRSMIGLNALGLVPGIIAQVCALACWVRQDSKDAARIALLDLEKLKYDLKGA